MTETDREIESEGQEAAELEPDAATDALFESVPAAAPTVIKKGGVISWLAMLVAIAACGLQGWQWWTNKQQPTDPAAIAEITEAAVADVRTNLAADVAGARDQIAEQRGRLDALISRVDQVQQRSRETEGELHDAGSLSADVELVQRQLGGLERRYNVIEQSIASLSDLQAGGVTVMDLAETEYLLRLAGERLALFGDPDTALRALRLADAQLRSVDDPLYNGVRQTLAEEMESLRQVEVPDKVALSGRLLSLAESANSWPLAGSGTVKAPVPTDADAQADAQDDAGLWAKARRVASSLVVVEQEAGRDSPLLSPERERAMRDGVALEFRTARLALLNADEKLYRHSLDRARGLLEAEFDLSSELVNESIAALTELSTIEFRPALPSLDRTLRQLRGLRAADGAGA